MKVTLSRDPWKGWYFENLPHRLVHSCRSESSCGCNKKSWNGEALHCCLFINSDFNRRCQQLLLEGGLGAPMQCNAIVRVVFFQLFLSVQWRMRAIFFVWSSMSRSRLMVVFFEFVSPASLKTWHLIRLRMDAPLPLPSVGMINLLCLWLTIGVGRDNEFSHQSN